MGNFSIDRLKRQADTVQEGSIGGARYAAIWHLERLNNLLKLRKLRAKVRVVNGETIIDVVRID